MNILCHGAPFCADWPVLDHYRGEHTIRRLGPEAAADVQYDPEREDASAILRRLSDEFPVDLIMCWTPDIYPPPAGLEDVSCTTAAFVSDWNVSHPLLEWNLGRYDFVFSDKGGAAHVLNRHGVQPYYVTPLYCAHPEHHQPLGLERDIDVLFLGSYHTAAHEVRTRLVAELARWHRDATIIIGTGFDWAAYGELLNRARIVVNHSIRGELNLRVFETLACGALPLIEADNDEVNQWFTPGEDIVTYNADNFLETIDHYLNHPEEAEVIATHAHARRDEWEGANRLDTLIDFIAANESQGRPYHDYDARRKILASWRQYAGAKETCYAPLAKRYADELSRAFPEDSVTPFVEAMTDDTLDEAAIAAKVYEAHRRDPNDVAMALNAARSFRVLSKASMEQRCLEAATTASGMSSASLCVGQPEERFTARWRRALAEGTATIAMGQAEAWYQLGCVHLERGDLERVEEVVTAIQRLDPEHGECWRLTMTVELSCGDFDGAIRSMENWLQVRPMNFALREKFIQTLKLAGEEARAQEEAEKLNLMRARVVQ